MKLLPPPGPERRSQLTRLGVMLVILAVLALYQFGLPTGAGTPAAGATTSAPPTVVSSNLPVPIGLDRLDTVPEDSAAGRNPFGYGQRPLPPPPPAPKYVPPPPPPPPPPPDPPRAPEIPLKLLALSQLVVNGPTIATLKDTNTGASFEAVEGQIIDGRFKLAKVSLTSVIVTYLDGSGQRVLGLG